MTSNHILDWDVTLVPLDIQSAIIHLQIIRSHASLVGEAWNS